MLRIRRTKGAITGEYAIILSLVVLSLLAGVSHVGKGLSNSICVFAEGIGFDEDCQQDEDRL